MFVVNIAFRVHLAEKIMKIVKIGPILFTGAATPEIYTLPLLGALPIAVNIAFRVHLAEKL